jgi:hypothetical protein
MKKATWIVSKEGLVALLILCGCIVGCSPVTQIRSSRIDSNFSMHTGFKYYGNDEYRIQWGANTEKTTAILPEPQYNVLFNTGFKFSFSRHAEVGLIFFPFPYYSLLGFELKIPVASFGKPSLFRNLGIAPYAGFTFQSGEWSGYGSAWFGTALGTIANLNNSDIELVLQPAISYADDSYQPAGFTVSGSGLTAVTGTGQATIERSAFELSLGAIYRLIPDKRLGLSGGVTYKHYFKNSFNATNSLIKFVDSENDPIECYVNLILVLVK